jgi:tetratricopeptide (TPR) repeat protein
MPTPRFSSKTVACLAPFLLAFLSVALRPAFAQNVGVTKKHVVSDPDAAELNGLLTAAQAAMDAKDYAAAAQDYQAYLAKKPGDAMVHFNLGYAYTAMQRAGDAKSEYEKAISLDPKMGPAYLNLGLTLLAGDPSAAVDPLQHAADLMPDQARPKLLLGAALEHAGKLELAIEQYQAAAKLDGANFDVHFALGRALLDSHRPGEAEPEFRRATQLDPSVAAAHLGLAESLIAQNKSVAAAAELDTYLHAKPNDASARIDFASVLADAGKYDDAIAQLDRAAAVRPEDLHALKLRAQIYWVQKKYDAALPALQKAQALAPNDPGIPAKLGHIYLAKKDYSAALQQLSVAYRLDPSASDVLADLAEAEYDNKNYSTALQALDALSKKTELPPAAWFFRAACYDKLEQPEQALDAYQKFLQLNTDQNDDMYFEATSRVRFLKRELENKKK